MKHFVVLADWAVDYQTGHEIVGVCHDLKEAKDKFKKRVETDERVLAAQYGYEISVDDDCSFEAGKSGHYVGNHLFVEIIEVKSNKEDKK